MLSETNTGLVQQSGHKDDQSHSLVMINKPHVNNQQTLKKAKGGLSKSTEEVFIFQECWSKAKQ